MTTIAVVGTGISGLVCADHLRHGAEVTVFEAGDHVGGHTHTVPVTLDDGTHHVDTGFIVHNDRNYPEFRRMLDRLGVPTRASDMSFSVSDARNGLEYRATSARTLFARRRNLLRPSFHRLLVDILRFHRQGRRLLSDPDPDPDLTLADFLERGRFSRPFVDDFLVPLGSAVWSADPTTYTRFPMVTLARFLANHGLLSVGDQPQWRTVVGGSSRYVEALTAPFADRIRLHSPVDKVVRHADGVEVHTADGQLEEYDHVVLATHSDQALEVLADATPDERDILGAIGYQPNTVTLHTDSRFLPRAPGARASWNYHVLPDAAARRRATVTYWMNNLQGLESRHDILLTLNRHDEIDPASVIDRYEVSHPVFDRAALAAQGRRHEIQGRGGTWYAGAYWGHGFHEDGVRSALDVTRALGAGP